MIPAIVSTTTIQRNFTSVLKRLHSSSEPLLIVRDSIAEAVVLPVREYQRLARLENQHIKSQMEDVWNKMRKYNARVSDEEIDDIVREAKKYAKNRRRHKRTRTGSLKTRQQ